jgi:hypothetical protein
MNGQNFGEHFNAAGFVEPTDNVRNNLGVDSGSFVEKDTPVLLAALVEQTPVDSGAVAPVYPLVDETVVQEAPKDETIVYKNSVGESVPHETPITPNADALTTTLLGHDESEHLRTRWNEIQGKFVDEPRSAVQQADTLVAEVVEKINKMFTDEHSALESQWKQGNDVSTEDLRKALQHYRSFFNRLVV